LDKNLSFINKIRCLSSTNYTQYLIIPEVSNNKGFLITYGEVRKYSYEIFSQFIENNGHVYPPVSLYSTPKPLKGKIAIDNYEVLLDKDKNLDYYMILREIGTDLSYLYKYQLSLEEYFKDVNYTMNKQNWHDDPEIKEINTLADRIEKNIADKKFQEYKRTISKSSTKCVTVDHEFSIQRLSEDAKINDWSQHIILYYDDNHVARLTKKVTIMNDKLYENILIYYNNEGNKIWTVKINSKGYEITDQYGIDFIEELLKSVNSSPYDLYHKDN